MIVDLHQNLNIETLQGLELIPKKTLTIQIIIFFKNIKTYLKILSNSLCGSLMMFSLNHILFFQHF
jgi:hypothetical protein